MFLPVSLSGFTVRFIPLVLSSLLVASPFAAADHPPPIAFSEQIVAESGVGTTVVVPLQFFDPSVETQPGEMVLAEVLQFPANLPIAGGSVGRQSCAFFGVCGFSTLGFVGTDRLIFRASSEEPGTGAIVSSALATVTLEIVASLDRAVGFNLQAGTFIDTPVPIRPGGTAPDDPELTYSIVASPLNGALDLPSAEIRDPVVYTPEPGYSGIDRFQFTVTDGVTVSEPATVLINVGASDAPGIASIRPTTGATTGGNDVSISGINFVAGDVEVAFGDAVVTTPISVTGTELLLTTPPNLEGTVDVRVTTSQGEFIVSNAFTYEPPVTGLVSAVLPAARSVQVGTDATAFGVIVNAGNVQLQGCGVAPVTALDADFAFQITDARTNELAGVENAVVDIQANGVQTFVFRLAPNSDLLPTEVELAFQCAGGQRAVSSPGVNTLLLSASAEPIPDVIAVVAVDSGANPAGTLSLDGPGNPGFFAVATTNVGASGSIDVETDTQLPISVRVCEVAEDCLAGDSTRLTTEMAENSVGSFFFLVEASEDIPFFPETSRLFVRFRDSDGVIRGSTSVAVTTD